MPYVDRDNSGQVTARYALAQRPGQECLPDDHPDLDSLPLPAELIAHAEAGVPLPAPAQLVVHAHSSAGVVARIGAARPVEIKQRRRLH